VEERKRNRSWSLAFVVLFLYFREMTPKAGRRTIALWMQGGDDNFLPNPTVRRPRSPPCSPLISMSRTREGGYPRTNTPDTPRTAAREERGYRPVTPPVLPSSPPLHPVHIQEFFNWHVVWRASGWKMREGGKGGLIGRLSGVVGARVGDL
jgi:hypothetical protein